MKALKLEDFLTYSYLSGLSEKDGVVYFIKTNADEKANRYIRNVHSLKDGVVTELTTSGSVASYRTDGKALYFIDRRSDEEKKNLSSTTIYRLPLGGGEAKGWKTISAPVSRFELLPEERLLLVVGEDTREKDVKKEDLEAFRKKNEAFEEIEEYPMYFNGGGFVSGRMSHLVLREKSGREKRVFSDSFSVDGLVLNKERTKAIVTGSRRDRKSLMDLYSEFREIDLRTGEWKTILEDGILDGAPFYLGDRIIVAGTDSKEYGCIQDPSFYSIEDGKAVLFRSWRRPTYSSVGSDCRLGASRSMGVYNGCLYFVSTIGWTSQLFRMDEKGTIEAVVEENGSVDDFVVTEDGKVYLVAMRGRKLQEIYDGSGRCLTAINRKALQGKYTAEYEKIEFENDGEKFTGWVLRPFGYEEGRKYPAILDIHGGPKTVYGEVFYHEMQYWAGKGYFVMFTNPRGSDGWGEDFADIRGKYGTIDYSDLMKFVDTVLEKYPEIDPERLGETGGSYGGFMSNWILGHTDRFKAIATQRSISNWISFAGTSDIGSIFVETHCGCKADNYQKLLEHSPIVGINERAKTPTLIIHSDQDYRCPVEQGYQVLAALKRRNVPVRMVLFHGENHELSRGGKPQGRIKRLQEITAWMDKYLM